MRSYYEPPEADDFWDWQHETFQMSADYVAAFTLWGGELEADFEVTPAYWDAFECWHEDRVEGGLR